jgi:predicted adenylyl cyclase CyaB
MVLHPETVMARNIEIKARIESVEIVAPRVAAIADQGPFKIAQDDAFFRCESGRLKLRVFSQNEGELIYYQRANVSGPKESFYLRSPTSAPESLRNLLCLACGCIGSVRKQRTLFLVGRTRVHLDVVENLGHFLELEVVLADGEPSDAGVREARRLMEKLGIESSQLIDDAYIDLLER